MKLLTAMTPNTLRVHAFLAEKEIDIPIERVDIQNGATRTKEFQSTINSLGEVPVLRLDDGRYLTESVAICRYLEGLHPQNPLFGRTNEESAWIEMWARRIELRVTSPIANVALHTFEFFKDKVEQLPEYAETQRKVQPLRWEWLNEELSDGRTYLVNDRFSMADIMGMTVLLISDLAEVPVPAGLSNVKRWEGALRNRIGWTAFTK